MGEISIRDYFLRAVILTQSFSAALNGDFLGEERARNFGKACVVIPRTN